jgi:hypothetical protein
MRIENKGGGESLVMFTYHGSSDEIDERKLTSIYSKFEKYPKCYLSLEAS